MLTIGAFVLFSYFLGSLSTAIITCKFMGLADPRSVGSSNPGATNVYELYGKKPAVITLVGDLLKGFFPVVLAKLYGLDAVELSLVALAAFLGHLYPLFFKFEGGKGVATAFGIILGLNFFVALALLVSWLLVFKIFKLSSLSALISSLLSPLCFYFLDEQYLMMSLVISLFLIWRHRSNIQNIINGTET